MLLNNCRCFNRLLLLVLQQVVHPNTIDCCMHSVHEWLFVKRSFWNFFKKKSKYRCSIGLQAGEVFESHILASLTSRAESLILIGDHQQLRPVNNKWSHRYCSISFTRNLLNICFLLKRKMAMISMFRCLNAWLVPANFRRLFCRHNDACDRKSALSFARLCIRNCSITTTFACIQRRLVALSSRSSFSITTTKKPTRLARLREPIGSKPKWSANWCAT